MITINWQAIDTVLLDMDGTLLDLHFDNYFWQTYLPEAYAKKQGLTKKAAEQKLFAHFEEIHGTLNWYSLDYWRHYLGMDLIALKKEVQHLIDVRPGAWDFLSFLSERGKRVILITNAHRDSLALKMDITGMETALDRLISTHDFGHPKEEEAFWRRLQQEEPFDPVSTLFIDDTPAILDAARCHGIRYLLAIHQPDSKAPPRPLGEYPQIEHFQQIMVSGS